MRKIGKAYAISNAKIGFVSLVDKAANKKQFLITKAEGSDGTANFQSFGRILKADDESHFVTGIVYEPMAEDTDGNYMTAAEIEKAAHWFMKNGGDVDIQHCFQKAEGVEVVESFVAKSDMEIEGEQIAKGTWLMTMEISDSSIWDSITKGEITGFSMGGTGIYSDEDVSLASVEKSSEKKGLFKKLAKAFGMEVVEKGAVKNEYLKRIKSDNFWTAFYALQDILRTEVYEPGYGYRYVFTEDEDIIREALTDFNEVITELLSSKNLSETMVKAAKVCPVEKAGKTMSAKNFEKLSGICSSLSDFASMFAPEDSDESGTGAEGEVEKSANKNIKKEDSGMTAEETQILVEEVVTKATEPIVKQIGEMAKADGKTKYGGDDAKKEVTEEDVKKMVTDMVSKSLEPIAKQVEAIAKSRALPGNLNDAAGFGIEKGEQHYMTGMF